MRLVGVLLDNISQRYIELRTVLLKLQSDEIEELSSFSSENKRLENFIKDLCEFE